jgi:hypothetical protein
MKKNYFQHFLLHCPLYIGTTKINKDLDRRGVFKKKINEKKIFSAFSNIITFNMHIKCFCVDFLSNNHPSAYY